MRFRPSPAANTFFTHLDCKCEMVYLAANVIQFMIIYLKQNLKTQANVAILNVLYVTV